MAKTYEEIRNTIVDAFLVDWNRKDWMFENGEWDEDADCVEEGTIDPDNVEGSSEECGVTSSWDGRDCREGWIAHRSGDALVLNWWRAPYPHTFRHRRDLWVVIDAKFFEGEEENE